MPKLDKNKNNYLTEYLHNYAMMDGQVSKAMSIRDTVSNNSKLALGPVIVVNMITRDQIVTKKIWS